ncbi:DUF3558 family protein [Nocardia yunnanensis]|uniref:DUF3558 family protein n=1 Tax=Nocardia yunnanensis TaxID=2382165 RepID=UPI0013C4D1ED|nr:DUF3558 family protein [Nocardia yunnanensis]
MRRTAGAAAGIALIGLAVAGCGGANQQATATTTTSAPKAVLPSPNTIALCGGVPDADIAQQTGLTDLRPEAANPMSCTWQSGDDAEAVVFHWFRGSSLTERRTQVTTGKPADVRVAGQAGLEWQDPATCELAVAFGDTDFIDWTVHRAAGAQPCRGLDQLATATLKQAGQGS